MAGSDANLIKGAADAASGATKSVMAGSGLDMAYSQAMQTSMNALQEQKQKNSEAKKRTRDLNEAADARMEDAMLKGGALGEEEFGLVNNKVAGWKKELSKLKLGDDAGRRAIMSKMSMQSQSLVAEKDMRVDNQELYKTLSAGVGANDRHAMSVFSDPQSGDYTLSEDAQGVKTYTIKYPEGSVDSDGNPMTEKEYSGQDIQKLFNGQQDLTSAKMTSEMSLESQKIGLNGGEFNESKIRGSFKDSVKNGDLMSIINDDWGVGSFKQNADGLVKKELSTMSTTEKVELATALGIPSIDGSGSSEFQGDVDDIVDALTNPDNPNYDAALTEQYAVQYMVDAQKQQYDEGNRQRKAAAASKEAERLEKYSLKKYESKLKIMVDDNSSQNDINEEISKQTTAAKVKANTKDVSSKESQAPDTFNVTKADNSGENVSITREVALDIGEKVNTGPDEDGVYEELMFTGAQGTYFRKKDGTYEVFIGSSADDIEEQILEANSDKGESKGIEKKNKEDIFEAMKRYNSERTNASGSLGGDGITLDKIKEREGVDLANQTTQVTVKGTEYVPIEGETTTFDVDDY